MHALVDDRPPGYALRRAVSFASARARGRETAGLWDRPALLDLVSDLLMLFVLLAALYALAIWFLARPFFTVREVVVLTPPAQVTVAQIEYAARSSITGNFFTVELEGVRTSFEKLPWVRRAEVRRRWPDAIELRLEEHQPVAYWTVAETDEIHLVNRQGEVFVAASNADMPDFAGPPGSAAFLLARYREYTEVLSPLGRKPVGLWLSPREAWKIQLDDGMVLLLGREQSNAPVGQRLERFVRTWPQAAAQIGVDIAMADLRYRTGFALTPAGQDQPMKGMQ
ncbi:FtsQ-type POTRA domain-containing protein [Azoarcus taiwanensis]|uniref:Cell division protein FtsQ n=1 Tax=Azoarcus taiwanensis TaxID=666964 RepID=A0A972F752_9RHOO|nr:FtsQ-type POTRA domain-containing protein [Azoarcus taiwanensis]